MLRNCLENGDGSRNETENDGRKLQKSKIWGVSKYKYKYKDCGRIRAFEFVEESKLG